MKTSSYKDLIVWQKSVTFVDDVYDLTETFPARERYCLADQMRRCAISLPSNIAEGSRRGSLKEFKRFLYYSYVSGSELETQLYIAERRSYGDKKSYEELRNTLTQILKMLNGLIATL